MMQRSHKTVTLGSVLASTMLALTLTACGGQGQTSPAANDATGDAASA